METQETKTASFTEKQKEEIKDFIFQAVQSGKKETSGLVSDIIKKIDNSYSIKDVIEQRFNEMGTHLTEIKVQTTKTNGRVTILENHKSYLWGAVTVLTLLGGIIITLSIIAIDSKIKSNVEQILTKYEQNK